MKAFKVETVKESELYDYVKERLRVLTADEFIDLNAYYKGALSSDEGNRDALLYGQALLKYKNNEFKKAWQILEETTANPSVKYVIDSLKIEVMAQLDMNKAKPMIDQILKQYPDNDVVTETTVGLMLQSKDFELVDRSIKLIRKLLVSQPENPHFYELLSIANYNALKPVQAGEAMARQEHLMGRNYRAVRILRNLKKDDDLDYYQAAEINALIAAYEPLISDRERQQEIAADGGLSR